MSGPNDFNPQCIKTCDDNVILQNAINAMAEWSIKWRKCRNFIVLCVEMVGILPKKRQKIRKIAVKRGKNAYFEKRFSLFFKLVNCLLKFQISGSSDV